MDAQIPFIIGIDPGLSGGIAFYRPGELYTYVTPTNQVEFHKKGKLRKRKEMDLPGAIDILKSHPANLAFIEHVTAMPTQGVTGMFRFGQNLGQWEGLLAWMDLEIVHVRPQKWKKFYGLSRVKQDSFDKARELFPDNHDEFKRKTVDEGRVEAALIACYGNNNMKITSSISI